MALETSYKTKTIALALLLLGSSNAFAPKSYTFTARQLIITNMASDKPAGSFFNQVPSDDNNDDKKKGEDDSERDAKKDKFDESFERLMANRKSKPRANSPSTLGGVPTALATGFGNKAMPKIKKGKKPFVGIGKPANDVTKPETDDQGYTLYTSEETGEKSRVFEALVEYPSIFNLKIIGENESNFAEEMVQIVADSCSVSVDEVKYSERIKGKWLSVTVSAPVESAEMLYSLYENVDKDPRVKFKF